MSFSDWLQIILSLIGFIAGAILSWIFYRAQKSEDYRELKTELTNSTKYIEQISQAIGKKDKENIQQIDQSNKMILLATGTIQSATDTISRAKEVLDIIKKVEDKDKLHSIHASINSIEGQLGQITPHVISIIKNQQADLLQELQTTFRQENDTALQIIKKTVDNKLKQFTISTADNSRLTQEVETVIKNNVSELFQQHFVNLQARTDVMSDKVGTDIDLVIKSTNDSLNELKEQTSNLVDLIAHTIHDVKNENQEGDNRLYRSRVRIRDHERSRALKYTFPTAFIFLEDLENNDSGLWISGNVGIHIYLYQLFLARITFSNANGHQLVIFSDTPMGDIIQDGIVASEQFFVALQKCVQHFQDYHNWASVTANTIKITDQAPNEFFKILYAILKKRAQKVSQQR